MLEAPDRRVWYLLGPVAGAFLLNALVDSTSSFAKPIEALLYVLIIALGATFMYLDLQEGYCLNRPSITREGSPALFWLEVLVALSLAIVGAWKLWQLM